MAKLQSQYSGTGVSPYRNWVVGVQIARCVRLSFFNYVKNKSALASQAILFFLTLYAEYHVAKITLYKHTELIKSCIIYEESKSYWLRAC